MLRTIAMIIHSVLFVVESTLSFACAMTTIDYYKKGDFDIMYIFITFTILFWAAVSLGELIRGKAYKKFTVITGLGMKLIVFSLMVGIYLFFDYEKLAGMIFIGASVVITVLFCIIYRAFFSDSEYARKQNSSVLRSTKFDGFYGELEWESAAVEYCAANQLQMKDLTEEEKSHIQVMCCTYIAYIFAWLVKREKISDEIKETVGSEDWESIKNELADPAEILFKTMVGIFGREDITSDMQPFIDRYFSGLLDIKGNSFYTDYEKIVSDTYYQCRYHDFSWTIYHSFEELFENRFKNYMISEEFRAFDPLSDEGFSVYCKTFGSELEVLTAENVSDDYRQLCIDHCGSLSDDMLSQICGIIAEYWGDTLTTSELLKSLSAGSLLIPSPYGDEAGYILGFEAEFEPEHGISITIRGEKVLEIGYRCDYESPWISIR